MSNHKFDEYKLFADSTQHLSERRQAATQTYLSVNTAIFAILALLVKEAGLKGGTLVGVSLPLFLVGIRLPDMAQDNNPVQGADRLAL